MKLKKLARHWDALGRSDPMWAILTDPAKRNRQWDDESFFATGVHEVDRLLVRAEELAPGFPRHDALDFGCGIGRLSQALARHFDRVVGVDIAPSMIRQATEANRQGDRVSYRLNETGDLRAFGDRTFDLVYSNIVLQHMRPEYARGYVREFLRVVRPGGLVVFQLPAELAGGSVEGCGRLPDDAFRAELRCVDPPTTAKPGAQLTLQVEARNVSRCPWPAPEGPAGRYSIRVGNHWLGRHGRLRVRDDGRTALPVTVAPGESLTVELVATAPTRPGRYLLELDLIQEHVSWFRDMGADTLRLPVAVPGDVSVSDRLRNLIRREPVAPRMEMYGVPRSEVTAWIEQNGAVLLCADDDRSPGPDWTSYRYFAARGGFFGSGEVSAPAESTGSRAARSRGANTTARGAVEAPRRLQAGATGAP